LSVRERFLLVAPEPAPHVRGRGGGVRRLWNRRPGIWLQRFCRGGCKREGGSGAWGRAASKPCRFKIRRRVGYLSCFLLGEGRATPQTRRRRNIGRTGPRSARCKADASQFPQGERRPEL